MPPAALGQTLYATIENILSGTNIPVKERTQLQIAAYKKISLYNLELKIVQNPLSGKQEKRIIWKDKIVAKKGEIKNIIRSFSKETKGAGSKRLYNMISKYFHGIRRSEILDWLKKSQTMTKLRPKFSNKAPMKPVYSAIPMERHQIDIVDMSAVAEEKDGQIFKYVLSVLDNFSRFLWLVPITNKSSETVAKALAKIYLDNQWGTPKIIQTDQGGEFKGMVKTLCERLGVRLIHSRAYHPQSQGKSERSHRSWKDCLRYDMQNLVDVSWVDSLPDYCRIHNESLNTSLGACPYKAMFGFEPHRLTRLLKAGGVGEGVEDYEVEEEEEQEQMEVGKEDVKVSKDVCQRLKELKNIRKDILDKSDKASRKMVEKAMKDKAVTDYEVGEIVLVRHKGLGKGVKRGGRKITSPKAKEGTILKVNSATRMYKIQIGKAASWHRLEEVTSLTQAHEDKRSKKRSYRIQTPHETTGVNTRQNPHQNVKKTFTPDAFASDVCSSEAEFIQILEKLSKLSSSPATPNALEKLERMADKRGLTVRHNAGGGDCMFLSLSHQIYHQLDLEMNALEVRDMVVDHLQKNPKTIDGTHLKNFVPGKKPWNRYLSEMVKKGTWGDNIMLMGAADVLEVVITVISTISDKPIIIKPRKKKAGLRKLCLGHLAEFHYVSLEKKGQKCKTCHQTLSVCRCAVGINADASDDDDSCRSPDLSRGDISDNDGSLTVTIAFFEDQVRDTSLNVAMETIAHLALKAEVCRYIKSLLQGEFSENKEGRGERHNLFITKYPYHEVKAGFGSDFVSAEVYGHLLQWIGQSFTRRLVRDKSRPYTESVTQIFTVPDVDEKLRKLPMEYTEAAWHYILYVAIKEVIVFLAEKLTGRNYSSINPECQRTELRSKQL